MNASEVTNPAAIRRKPIVHVVVTAAAVLARESQPGVAPRGGQVDLTDLPIALASSAGPAAATRRAATCWYRTQPRQRLSRVSELPLGNQSAPGA